MESINILISAILSKTSAQDLEQELKKIQNKLKPLDVKVNLDDFNAELKIKKDLQSIDNENIKNLKKQEAEKEKILQYEQKVRLAIQKNAEIEKIHTKELQQQIELFQRKMSLQSNQLTSKYGSLVDSGSLNALNKEIGNLSVSTPDVQNKMKNFALSMEEIRNSSKNSSNALKLATQDARSFGDEIVKDFQKFGLWFGIGTAFMSTIHSIQEAITFTNELNKAMTNISMITGRSSEEISVMTKDYSNLASTLHDTTQSVMQASEEFLRAGHSHEETIDLIKSSTMMSKIAGQNQKETAEQLIAITNAYGDNIKSTIDVVDKLTTVDNNSATSTKELGTAIERTAVSAQMAGVGFERLVAMIKYSPLI